MIQKLAQYFDKLIAHAVRESQQGISPPTDIKYECGRRIGLLQGLQRGRQALLDFRLDTEKDDEL